ncbi:hypothetical protein MPSEU_000842900 [Mayamaea pseudoterrestris]|nr:hypothetical protein MPSEU_000842900 [Mayamaea pseudoterrestris]
MRRTARIAGNVSHLYRLVTCSRVTLFSTIGPCHGWATAPARRSSSSYSKEPYDDWIINPHLRQHLRPSLAPNLNDNDAIDQSRDTGMSLIFLGTGAGKPTPKRSNAATALRRGGNVYLIDAGEGVQLQIMKSKLSGAKVTKIFSEFV